MVKLYLNNTLVDISENSIAITKQFKTIEDLSRIQSSFSNVFDLPHTERNEAFFRDSCLITSTSNILQLFTADLYFDEFCIVKNGQAYVESHNLKGYKCRVYDNFVTFFEKIKDKKITDINLGTFDFTWNWATVIDRLNDPLDSYYQTPYTTFRLMIGNDNPSYGVTDTNSVYVDQLIPMINFKGLLYYMANNFGGYTLDDDGMTDTMKNMLAKYCIALSDLKYSGTIDFNANGVDLDINNLPWQYSGLYKITNVVEISDQGNNFDNNEYTIPCNGYYTFRVDYLWGSSETRGFYTAITKNNDHTVANALVKKTNTTQYGSDTLVYSGFFYSGETVQFAAGDVSGRAYPLYLRTVSFTLTSYTRYNTSYGGKVTIQTSLPDLSCTEFIRTICALTGSICLVDEENKKIRFVRLDELKENSAYDWSNKFLYEDSISFSIGLPSIMNFKFEKDDIANPYGVGDLTLKNDKAFGDSSSKDIYSLKVTGCAAVAPVNVSNYGVAGYEYYPVLQYNTSTVRYTYKNKLKPIVFSVKVATGKSISVRDNFGNSTYISNAPFAIFSSDSASSNSENLNWGNIILKNYDVFTDMLDESKKVIAYFNLTGDDLGIDVAKPIYVSYYNSFFYLNKIVDYMPGKPTKVELIKIVR